LRIDLTQIVGCNDCGLVFRRYRYRYGSVSDRRPLNFLFSHSRLPPIPRIRDSFLVFLSSCLLYLIGALSANSKRNRVIPRESFCTRECRGISYISYRHPLAITSTSRYSQDDKRKRRGKNEKND